MAVSFLSLAYMVIVSLLRFSCLLQSVSSFFGLLRSVAPFFVCFGSRNYDDVLDLFV